MLTKRTLLIFLLIIITLLIGLLIYYFINQNSGLGEVSSHDYTNVEIVNTKQDDKTYISKEVDNIASGNISPEEYQCNPIPQDNNYGEYLNISGNDDDTSQVNDYSHEESIINFAIFGSDARGNETSRSDIIIVIQYDINTRCMKMLSIPRDSRVYIPGYFTDKINHSYAYGGPELLRKTIENLLEIKVDHYIKLSFANFKNIINELGGVKVNAKKDFSGDSITINKGEQLLNGDEALFYVRYRSDSEGDFGRIERQQEVIESITKSIAQYDSCQILELLTKIYTENMVTDFELGELEKIMNLSNQEFDIVFKDYTLQTTSKVIDGIWYEIIDEDFLEEIKEIYQ